jgi:hypothetical protein
MVGLAFMLRFSATLGEEPEVEVALVAREATRRVALWAYRERSGGLWGGWRKKLTREGGANLSR